MTGFIIAALLVVWFGAVLFSFHKALEDKRWLMVVAFLFITSLGSVIQLAINEGDAGPCLEYETRYMYNPALKMTLPVRVCTMRGEWVE